MTGKNLLIALAVLALAAPASAAQSRKKAEPPPPPVQFRVDVATRTMSLQRAISQVPSSAVIGKAARGLLCVAAGEPIYTSHVFTSATPAELAQIFAQELAAAGYNVPTSQTNMFDTAQAAQAELAVGVALLEIKESGCVMGSEFGYKASMDATVKVEWQVFDPLEKKLLFRATSEGSAKLRQSTDGSFSRLPTQVAGAAFQAAAKVILADPNFVAAVRDPKGGAAPASGELFPEAKSGQSIQPSIARVPQSTAAFKDQVEKLRAQVVTVETSGGSGSGFYIADGFLLTNHHVIAGTQRVKIRFFGGRQIDGQVVASNAKRDVALIKTESAGVAGLPLKLENPELTSQVFVIGSPLGEKHEGSVTAGIVSAFRNEDTGPFIQSDVAVDHGNSGGPMFDDRGNVIGLVDLGLGGRATVNLFIPIGDALRVLEIGFAP